MSIGFFFYVKVKIRVITFSFSFFAYRWCFRKPFAEKIQVKDGDVETVIYAAKRIDPEVTFTDEACAKLTGAVMMLCTIERTPSRTEADALYIYKSLRKNNMSSFKDLSRGLSTERALNFADIVISVKT